MANQCPCGCGRKVPLGRGGAAKVARRMAGWLEALREVDPEVFPPEHRGDLPVFIENGEQLEAWLLEHVHKTALPGRTPDLMDLNRRVQAFEGAAVKVIAV